MLDEPSDLRLADLTTFLAVQRCGSVTGAARELRVTPSQVSKSVARLEAQLNMRLLARSSRGVTTSDAGLRILPHLEEVVARLRELGRPERQPAPQLTVAGASYVIQLFLPVIATRAPQLRLRGIELPPPLIRAWSADNFFDLAITLGQARLPDAWVNTPVGEIRKGLFASPATAARLGPPPVPVERLRELPFIGPIYNVNGHFVPADDDCPLRYGERKLGHEVQTIAVALELAARTPQLVFGPWIAGRSHVERGALVEVKVKGWNVKEELYVSCNSDRVLAPVHKAVVESLRAALAGPPDGKATRRGRDPNGSGGRRRRAA
jgi:DNA-binding transcriptional LysR family regulator